MGKREENQLKKLEQLQEVVKFLNMTPEEQAEWRKKREKENQKEKDDNKDKGM